MGKNHKILNRFLSISLTAAMIMSAFPGSASRALAAGEGQSGGQQDLQNMMNPMQQLMQMLGMQEIAKGTQNENQGQQTQNMQQMAMGAMQIAQGLLGLMAAAAAGDKSATSADRESGLTSASSPYVPGTYSPGSGTGGKSGGGTTGETKTTELGSGTTPGISTIDLTSKPISTALASIEKDFGIPRDKFVEALKNGMAPKDIFANAPKNKIPLELGGKIADGLAAQYAQAQAEGAAKLAADSQSGALASAGGAGTGGAPTGSASSDNPRMPASTAPPSEELEDLNAANTANLSPEIKAAMAAKAAALKREKEMKEMHGWSIFQLVANRYRKLEPMLYGRVERTNPNPVPPQVRN